ncbi:MAG: hypothetical protein EOM31_03565 [Bacteroidia bacterium]|nr:hypothetical protein [Bacteroidia bacterium]
MRHLDDYINRQKQTEPSPFLVDKILKRLEEPQPERTQITFWQGAAVAASVVIVVMLGISIGNSFKQPTEYLSINDNQIENFSILITDENE